MAWKEQEWGLCWCSGQSSNKRNTEELLWQWNFSLFRFQPPLINFSKVCEERRVEHRALLCALTAAELLSKAIFSSLQLPAQGEQGCHLPLNIPALLSAQPHLNLGLKRTLRRFKVRWDSDLFHPQGHSSGPSDLLPVAGAGWHLPFHRVYNGTQSLCCFIFPFPHGFLLQFPIPSSSSFLSIHSRPLSPFYSRDNEPDVKFPSSAITSSLWSLKPAEWVWQSWAEGHRVQSRGWVWVWSSITTSSEIAGMELSEGSGFLSRELGQAHSCAAAFPPHLYLWAEPQPPHTFPSGSTAKLWDEFPSTGDLILFPPVLPSALPPPILQKAMPDWEHSIQQLPGGQEWFISAGDWTRLCLALVPRFRNNNVMNNPFMFIHLV